MVFITSTNGPYQHYRFQEVENDIRNTAKHVHQLGFSTRSPNDIVKESLSLFEKLKVFCNNPPTTWNMGFQENGSETLILDLFEVNGMKTRLKPASVCLSSKNAHNLDDIVHSSLSREKLQSEFYQYIKNWYVHHISVYNKITTIEIAPEIGQSSGSGIPPKLMHARMYAEEPVTAKTVSRTILAMVLNSQSERDWACNKLTELADNVMQSVSLQEGLIKFDMEVICRQIKHELSEHRKLRALLYAMFVDEKHDGFFNVNEESNNHLEINFNREGNVNNRINWSVLVAVVLSIILAVGSLVLQIFFDNVEIGSFVEVLTASLIITVGYVAVIREPNWDLLYALQAIEPLGRYYQYSGKEQRKNIVIALMKRGIFAKRFGRQFTSFVPNSTSGNINLAEPLDLQDLNKGGALIGICNGKLGVLFDGDLTVTDIAARNRLYQLDKEIAVLTLTDYAPPVRIAGSGDLQTKSQV